MQSSLLPEMIIQAQPDGWEVLRQQAEQALIGQVWPDIFQKSWGSVELDLIKNMMPKVWSGTTTISTDQIPTPETMRSSMVFINGHFDISRSNTSDLPTGVQMLDLASNRSMVSELGSLVGLMDANLLVNINTARFMDGLLLIVPEGVQVESPLRVSFINGQTDNKQVAISLPRLLIVLKSGSSVTLLEDYQGYGRYLTSSVTEVIVGSNARLNHERVQRESHEALHFSQLAISVGRDGHYNGRTVSLGGLSSWLVQNLTMVEQGADVTLDGLTIISDNQKSSTQSTIDHSSSDCTSKQAHRIIADKASLATFDGIICVHKDTKGTNAQQQCRGMLLAAEAQISLKPQLKIYADDVKCGHGAAVGQLDPEMLFYLQSRGVHPALARNMLTYAFASYLLANVSIPSLKKRLYKLIMAITNAEYLETFK